jgi:hypothetical protein
MDDAIVFKDLESLGDHAIRLVGSGIEIFGVLIIVTGIAWSTDAWGGYRGLQDPHWPITPAWSRGSGSGRYRENYRA